MSQRPNRLDRPVDPRRDHILGRPDAAITLVEYGSYACPSCHAAHAIIAELRDRFGDRMRYVFRHRPLTGNELAWRAAELAECAGMTADRFWPVHDRLMRRGPELSPGELELVAGELAPEDGEAIDPETRHVARLRVEADMRSAGRSGALVTPTFFINGRRYEGPWDQSSLGEAMLGSLGHRLHAASVEFARWAPSTGLLLLLMSLLAILLVNSPVGPAFEAFWHTPFGLSFGAASFAMPLQEWVNSGLLSAFFLVVGLEIKREFTIGRLSNRRAAALPVAASIGGAVLPALIYLALVPAGAFRAGWGVPIATDTAFAIALIVLLGHRVPVELRVFLTAAVIVDDLVAITVVALFYSGEIGLLALAAAVALTGLLGGLNRGGVYHPLPYAIVGVALWAALHEAGLHATLAGVILAVVTPTRPPANLRALLAQAETVIQAETAQAGSDVLRHGPSEPAMAALNAIHDRIASPADKLLQMVEPWSSYLVLPVFALANAGVVLSAGVWSDHALPMLAIIAGLVIGKPVGMVAAAMVAVRFRIAVKPAAYTWRQLAGAGALGGIGFTMSLFIAGQAFPRAEDFTAAKIAIFLASLLAGLVGSALLWRAGGERAETPEPEQPAG